MTGFRIIFDDGSAQAVLTEAIESAGSLGPVLAAIGGEVDDRVQSAFEFKRDPVTLASWPELTAATVRERERKGFGATETLQRTRILRNSVITDVVGNTVEVSVSGVEYALHHFLGAPGANIPRRRFAGVSPDDIVEFEEIITAHILGH